MRSSAVLRFRDLEIKPQVGDRAGAVAEPVAAFNASESSSLLLCASRQEVLEGEG